MKKFLALVCATLVFPTLSFSNPEATSGNPELVVHLLDYLAKDYQGAVLDGKVVNQLEYDEQVEFAEIITDNINKIEQLAANQNFKIESERLVQTIKAKGQADDVTTIARNLQKEAIQTLGLIVEPKQWPNLSVGEKLYQNLCTACHGLKGRGDGPAGAHLDPKPSDFLNPDLIASSTPYMFYNAIRLGVPGTGMTSFPQLDDREAWSLAFYLKSLPHKRSSEPTAPPIISLHEAATLSDLALEEKLSGTNSDRRNALAALRNYSGEGLKTDHLEVALTLLSQSLSAAQLGEQDQSLKLALRSYLEGIEPIEPKISANAPELLLPLELAYSNYRTAINKGLPFVQLQRLNQDIFAAISKVRTTFSDTAMSPAVAFGAAFSIILREGFEAVLIIVLLISILRALGFPESIKWVHLGWTTAIAVGLLGWFMSGFLVSLSGMRRELLEGAISILAVVILLYVGFWLHRYTAAKKWREFLEEKLKKSLSRGRYVTLATIAFAAVFREAFEVVLFMRAIWLDLDPTGQNYASAGVFSSFLLLLTCSYLVVKESRRLPLALLFQFCSWTMVLLAVVLAGKGVHSLQEAGYVNTSPTNLWPRWDLFGFHPSIQTCLAQLTVIVIFTILWYKNRIDTKEAVAS